jgi:hypothetical protein
MTIDYNLEYITKELQNIMRTNEHLLQSMNIMETFKLIMKIIENHIKTQTIENQ